MLSGIFSSPSSYIILAFIGTISRTAFNEDGLLDYALDRSCPSISPRLRRAYAGLIRGSERGNSVWQRLFPTPRAPLPFVRPSTAAQPSSPRRVCSRVGGRMGPGALGPVADDPSGIGAGRARPSSCTQQIPRSGTGRHRNALQALETRIQDNTARSYAYVLLRVRRHTRPPFPRSPPPSRYGPDGPGGRSVPGGDKQARQSRRRLSDARRMDRARQNASSCTTEQRPNPSLDQSHILILDVISWIGS